MNFVGCLKFHERFSESTRVRIHRIFRYLIFNNLITILNIIYFEISWLNNLSYVIHLQSLSIFLVSPYIFIMDQTKTNVNNTSPNEGKESSPFSSGTTTPNKNYNSINWFVLQSESSKFPSFWDQRFNLWFYDIFFSYPM